MLSKSIALSILAKEKGTTISGQDKSSNKHQDRKANTEPAVQIAEPPPPSPGDGHPLKKQFSAGTSSRRLSGRPPPGTASSRASIISQTSLENLNKLVQATTPPSAAEDSSSSQPRRHRLDRASEKLVSQIAAWLQREKDKAKARKTRKVRSSRRKSSKSPPPAAAAAAAFPAEQTPALPAAGAARERAPSVSAASDSSEVSLDRLQRILEESMASLGLKNMPHFISSPRLLGRRHSKKSLSHRSLHQLAKAAASSDTEYHHDGDVLVPSCDGFLDNSKSLSYTGGRSGGDVDDGSGKEDKEKLAWVTFKNEIIRLSHTLPIKGWRRVPLDSGDRISVERLSGALTNAVYVVSPPADLPPPEEGKKPPAKVLLRIYGPQVDIDRENELQVLRRLARKKIGPRLLGTFLNGRFEQFFNATTLTPSNLREPETSKQIAKRMRELHEGIELLEEERMEGPAVWKNWDRWVVQAERTVMALDTYVLEGAKGKGRGKGGDAWKRRGLVCGAEWKVFRSAVEKYRGFLDEYYGGRQKIREKLVFAHNDVSIFSILPSMSLVIDLGTDTDSEIYQTQYGNILRIRPDDEKSPLLNPENEHKQLIVIDFEYAGANLPGLEFANHFTEWAYNYHDAAAPYVCNTAAYPTPEQQHRFIRSYVDHKPQFPHGGASTPKLTPATTPATGTPGLHSTSSASSIVEFMLDARVPPGGWKEEETRREEEAEARVKELMEETRLWRVANSAQWVAWGIVQANIPGLVFESEKKEEGPMRIEELESTGAGGAGDEFDYLGYAQQRALFFWGDCVLMGIVKAEELPEELRGRLKFVKR